MRRRQAGGTVAGAVIYTRVSSAGQAETGISLDAQATRARAWAESQALSVLAVHTDAGVSGTRADNRPELQAALDRACRERAVLVVYSLSRLARSVRDTLDIAERLDRAGARLVSLSESLDTQGAAGRMLLAVLAAMSQFEADLAGERTALALAHLRSKGFATGGDAPFGHAKDEEGRLVEVPAEQVIIRTARALRAEGHSLRAVGEHLRALGHASRTGGEFAPEQVRRMIAA